MNKKNGLAALLIGAAPHDEEQEQEDGQSMSDLHAHQLNAMHEFMSACHKDDADLALEAWNTMHDLAHAIMDHGEAGYEDEQAEEDGPEENGEEG